IANHPHNPGYKNSIINDFSQNFLRPTPFDKEPKKESYYTIRCNNSLLKAQPKLHWKILR
ncbi:hypothetical protein, partial [Weissella cibaria]|uniref:hypothetical protein n=1 Tax=Weissella cibaria TaxID=137591 RepID=UPI0021C135E7